MYFWDCCSNSQVKIFPKDSSLSLSEELCICLAKLMPREGVWCLRAQAWELVLLVWSLSPQLWRVTISVPRFSSSVQWGFIICGASPGWGEHDSLPTCQVCMTLALAAGAVQAWHRWCCPHTRAVWKAIPSTRQDFLSFRSWMASVEYQAHHRGGEQAHRGVCLWIRTEQPPEQRHGRAQSQHHESQWAVLPPAVWVPSSGRACFSLSGSLLTASW